MMTSLMYKPGAVEWAMLAVFSHTLFMTAKPTRQEGSNCLVSCFAH